MDGRVVVPITAPPRSNISAFLAGLRCRSPCSALVLVLGLLPAFAFLLALAIALAFRAAFVP